MKETKEMRRAFGTTPAMRLANAAKYDQYPTNLGPGWIKAQRFLPKATRDSAVRLLKW